MKKLLSICFLSMLLGLFSFGVRAQNGNGCTSGFWIENLQPDTIYGVVNMPPDGKLPLMHTLGTGHYYNSGVFKSNVVCQENSRCTNCISAIRAVSIPRLKCPLTDTATAL